MKQYRKNWLLSFSLSVMSLTCLILGFMLFMQKDGKDKTALPETNHSEPIEEMEPFVNPDDNVGAVTLTEDRLTELARNMYFLDGYLNNINVSLEESGVIMLSARVKDTDKLCAAFPELDKYKILLSSIENREISVSCEIVNDNGRASISVTDITIDGVEFDGSIITPFVEQADFASVFDVEYGTVSVSDGVLTFSDGVPDILSVEK